MNETEQKLIRVLEIARNLLNDLLYDENWRQFTFEDYEKWYEELKEIEKSIKK